MGIILTMLALIAIYLFLSTNLKAVYVHYNNQTSMPYVWLMSRPEIRISGNAYKEKIGKDIHIHIRDNTGEVRIPHAKNRLISVYIRRGKICVLS